MARLIKKSEAAWAVCLAMVESKLPPPKALRVTVLRAAHLPKMDLGEGTCDAIVIFSADDGQSIKKVSEGGEVAGPEALTKKKQRKRRSHLVTTFDAETSVIKNTYTPEWNESFHVGFRDDQYPGRLTLNLFDHDEMSGMDFMGHIGVSCSTLEEWMRQRIGFTIEQTFEVENDGQLVVGQDQEVATLTVHFAVVRDADKEAEQQVRSPWLEPSGMCAHSLISARILVMPCSHSPPNHPSGGCRAALIARNQPDGRS